MHIFVGSLNPVKINAVIGAASETWPDVTVEGFDVPSGISEQPKTDLETRTGAINRANATLIKGIKKFESLGISLSDKDVLSVGLEGGVFDDADGQMWSTVWVAVVDKTGYIELANGARFRIPKQIAEKIRNGEEMGPVVSELVGEADVRKKQGMIGVATNGFVDRTEEYQGIAKLAIGLWYGREIIKKFS